jgi:hypothetical protein
MEDPEPPQSREVVGEVVDLKVLEPRWPRGSCTSQDTSGHPLRFCPLVILHVYLTVTA